MLCDRVHAYATECMLGAVILFDKSYLLLQVTFPIQKWPYFSQFCLYFPKYNEKSIYLFPNVKAQVLPKIGGKNTVVVNQITVNNFPL